MSKDKKKKDGKTHIAEYIQVTPEMMKDMPHPNDPRPWIDLMKEKLGQKVVVQGKPTIGRV